MSDNYDIVIIGGGPAGMTAAMYAARAGMRTLIIEKALVGGQLWLSESIENYPGFPEGITSAGLADNMKKQAEKFGAVLLKDGAERILNDNEDFIIETYAGKRISAPGVIVTAGASMKTLGVKGENEFLGKGVSYCAVCDGPLFRDKAVAVVGGGNTACEEAIYLTRFASKVYLIHRRPALRAIKNIRDKVENNQKIELLLRKEVFQINGDEFVKSIKFKDGCILDVEGVFIFTGLEPATECVKDTVSMEKGFIVTDENLMTSMAGIFAAGDCRYGALRQVVSACGEGAKALEETRKYVERKKGTSYDW